MDNLWRIPLKINDEVHVLDIPNEEHDLYNKLCNDNEYTLQYIQFLIEQKVIEADNLVTLERVDDNNEVFETICGEQVLNTSSFSLLSTEEEDTSVPDTEKTVWGSKETLMLINSVESRYDDLHHITKRKVVWKTIAEDLQSADIRVSSTQCKIKWNNLVRTYKSCVDNQNKTGRGPVKFHFFERLNEFLGNKPNISKPASALNILDIDRPSCSSQATDVPVQNESKDSEKENTTPLGSVNRKKLKKKNYTCEYLKIKTEYYKTKNQERKRRNDLLERKLELQEKTLSALEALLARK